MAKKNPKADKIILIMTGYSCNNNCIICSNRLRSNFYDDRTTEEIRRDIGEGKREGYGYIEFTGGEPTMRPDFWKLVKYAKDLGFVEIGVSTNGRLFSYDEFCEKSFSNGINRITFTLYGPNANIHNSITRTPGSFEQTIKGIKNCVKRSNIALSVNTVVCKINAAYLEDTGKLISSFGVKFWSILDLIPDGHGVKFYKSLFVRINDLAGFLNKANKMSDKFAYLLFFDFPLCLFTRKVRNKKGVGFVTAKRRMEIATQVGYNPKRFEIDQNSCYQDCHKIKPDFCNKCIFNRECAGIWDEYEKQCGSKELEILAKKNQCFIK